MEKDLSKLKENNPVKTELGVGWVEVKRRGGNIYDRGRLI